MLRLAWWWCWCLVGVASRAPPRCPATAEYSPAGLAAAPPRSPRCRQPDGGTVFTMVPRGQLGNHLHSYAALRALSLRYPGREFLLATETWHHITQHFLPDKLLLPGLHQLCLCRSHRGLPARPWHWRHHDSPPGADMFEDISGLEEAGVPGGTVWLLWPDRGFLYRPDQSGLAWLEQGQAALTRSLQFRPQLLEWGQQQRARGVARWLRRNRKKVEREKLGVGNLTVVGIHHRRGDHLALERVYRIPHPSMAYLGPSMDHFRTRHNFTVFLYVSDDPEWGARHLGRDRDTVLSSSPGPPSLSTGRDLALMSLCQHTVLTRGSFSFWCGQLAGGSYIRPCMVQQFATQEEQQRREGRAERWPRNPLHTRWQTSLWREC